MQLLRKSQEKRIRTIARPSNAVSLSAAGPKPLYISEPQQSLLIESPLPCRSAIRLQSFSGLTILGFSSMDVDVIIAASSSIEVVVVVLVAAAVMSATLSLVLGLSPWKLR